MSRRKGGLHSLRTGCEADFLALGDSVELIDLFSGVATSRDSDWSTVVCTSLMDALQCSHSLIT